MADTVQSNSSIGWLADPLRATRDAITERAYRFTGDRRAWVAPIGLGLALLAISIVGWIQDAPQFYFSYLVGWTFLLTTAIGGVFFLIFQHLTKAAWSVVVRRINEAIVWAFPLLFLLGLPLLFGMHDLYHWTHAELYDPNSPSYDAILAGKQSYLNVPFWSARMVVYFLIWSFISYKLYALSIQQDATGDPDIPSRLRTVSAWGLPVMAVTTAFASYDILMSLDPHWFSTIFGVYFFIGGTLCAVAVMTFLSIAFQNAGMLKGVITAEHYQDLGKYMFGFTVFWAYIAFSQYMLIWYGGIPEEIAWYQHRLVGGWGWHSAFLLLLHFVVPFFILIARAPKRMPFLMAVMSVWFMVMHWFDLHWISMPVLNDTAGFHWLDFTCWLGLASLFGGLMIYRLKRHALVPTKAPYLADSLHFENS